MEIVKNSKQILTQLVHLINSLTKDEYTSQLNMLNKSTIGQHIRHVVEFYNELEKGYSVGKVDYDNRKRNLSFEVDQNLVKDELHKIIGTIKKYDLEKELLVESNYGLSEKGKVYSKSSCRREIVYVLDHAVHHLAIIKIAIQTKYKHINLDADIGIAPSTLRNIKNVCAQ